LPKVPVSVRVRLPCRWPLPPVARPRQHLVELAANHLFDEAANLFAQLLFDRIKPILEKMRGNIGR
jgi:hypothetical protein